MRSGLSLLLCICIAGVHVSLAARTPVQVTARTIIAGNHSELASEAIHVHPERASKAIPVTIKAYWMRHGLSCANIIREFTNAGILTQHSYADPSLTDCAVKTAQVLGPQIERAIRAANPHWRGPLLVFSSVLVRAMETALHNFPGENVYPIPFIAEADNYPDNKPLSWDAQEETKLPRPPNSPADIQRIVHYDTINPEEDEDRDSKEEKHNYDTFKNEFPKIVTMLLLEKQSAPVLANVDIPVIIVSHSGYMKKNLACRGTDYPKNNEVWMNEYTAVLLKSTTLKERDVPRWEREAPPMQEKQEQGHCVFPFDVAKYPKYKGTKSMGMKYPCSQDVARCSKTNLAMPGEVDGECCNVEGTSLV